MTVDQVIAVLRKEQQSKIPSRFPCRAIMVKNVRQYCDLLAELQKKLHISKVPSSDIFSSADVMPRYENLQKSKYKDQWIILTGVSEYLRLFNKSEAESQRFAKLWTYKAPGSSIGRIIIPLWGCEAQWHDKSLHLCEDVRQNPYYYNCSDDSAEEQEMNLLVLSGIFEQYISKLSTRKREVFIGLQKWYEYWSSPIVDRNDQILLTKRYTTIQSTTDSVSIHVIEDIFSFVRENLIGGYVLTKENCPDKAASLLLEYALAGYEINTAILTALNIATFSGVDVMGKWKTMSLAHKQLVHLWYQLHPDDSYLCHCIQTAESSSDIPQHILHDIFALRNYPNWVPESQELINALDLPKDEAYFEALDRIPVYEDRLQYLTGKDKKERIYLLHLVGRWIREDANQVLSCETLKVVYPELAAYLDGELYDEDLRRYFTMYKSHKLENSLPADEELYFSGIQTDIYDFRFTTLSNAITEDSVILWLDGLGIEWLPLLCWGLGQNHHGNIKSVAVTQATLPTDTCFNEQWKQMNVPYKKLDRLDKLAHRGVIDDPDYYTCIEDQIAFVASISSEVDYLLKNYHRIIITGDHGTSRLAARFFHKRDGMPVPQGAKVFSHGRYRHLPNQAGTEVPHQLQVKDREGNYYAVFSNYDHFVQSGFAAGADDENAIYGEIHGGATPEEMLVPVVVYENAQPLLLKARWKKNPIKIKAKRVKATLEFNQPVENLQAKIGSIDAVCSLTADKKHCIIDCDGIAPNTYQVTIVADGSLVNTDPLQILPALGVGEGDLP